MNDRICNRSQTLSCETYLKPKNQKTKKVKTRKLSELSKTEQNRLAKLNVVLVELRHGENVKNCRLATWLTEDEYESFESDCVNKPDLWRVITSPTFRKQTFILRDTVSTYSEFGLLGKCIQPVIIYLLSAFNKSPLCACVHSAGQINVSPFVGCISRPK